MVRMQRSLVLGALLGVACSSNAVDTGVPHLSATSPGGGSGTGGGTSCEPFCSGGGGEGTGGVSERDPFAADGGGCAEVASAVETLPADLYIMFDQSSSMADPLPDGTGTWWTAAQDAVKRFVNDPQAVGMGVGIQYFPLNGVAPNSCTAPYDTPDVELAPLPGNSAAIAASIDAHQPQTFTPTGPALQGAVNHMKTWAAAHPARAPIVVLVTDGFPTECDPQQITDVAAIAKTAFETDPPVRTFVVGFNLGQAGENLKTISQAGGSGAPFLISGGDVGAAFTEALLGISAVPLQCTFPLPKPADPTDRVDPDKVRVTLTPKATGREETVARLNNQGDCQIGKGQGWYYDSPASPTLINLCPGTCGRLTTGVLQTVLGCTTGGGGR